MPILQPKHLATCNTLCTLSLSNGYDSTTIKAICWNAKSPDECIVGLFSIFPDPRLPELFAYPMPCGWHQESLWTLKQ